MLKAVDAIAATGATPVAVVTLIDRGDVARPLIEARGLVYVPMATYTDLGIDPVLPV